ncbi:MAG: type II toxin-antitoxin system VapC family toxin [Thermoleophilaceae bacterium]
MKLVDANVLLYAVNEDAPHHAAARDWLDDALSGQEGIGFAWVVLLAFLRLGTRGGLFDRPLALAEAVRIVELWLAQPPAVAVHPTERHLALLHGLLDPHGTAANLVSDAHLAALALEHGAEVVSFDADFGRFEGVSWHRPSAQPR